MDTMGVGLQVTMTMFFPAILSFLPVKTVLLVTLLNDATNNTIAFYYMKSGKIREKWKLPIVCSLAALLGGVENQFVGEHTGDLPHDQLKSACGQHMEEHRHAQRLRSFIF